MNTTRRCGIFIRFDEKHAKMVSEATKRTGERKVDFFKRIVEAEHNRIEKGLSISEAMNDALGTILAQTRESSSTMKTLMENTKASRDGANMIFPATLFLMRELYRLTHFLVNALIKNGIVQPHHLTALIAESNEQASQSFISFYHTIMNTPSKGIIEFLKKG